jgi:flagellar motor switch protein FliM
MANDQQLTQAEVDALMVGVTGENSAGLTTSEPVEKSSKAFNLGTDERIVRSRMHTLEVINDRFARNFRLTLLTFMRRNADISIGSIQIQKYGDMVKHLPVPAHINLIHLKPLRGTALFVFDPKLVFLVVDNLFGSDGRYHMESEGRDFTLTEQRIVKKLLNVALESYVQAWKPVYSIKAEYLRSEMHAKMANIVASNEVVISTDFQIEIGTVSGTLKVCIPYAMLEPIRELLTNPLHDEIEVDKRWASQMSSQVQSAEVEIVANFLTINSNFKQILELRAGDILPIEIPESITADINGIPVMECSFGTSKYNYALNVLKMIDSRDNHFNLGIENE